jgi:hypothetical protein
MVRAATDEGIGRIEVEHIVRDKKVEYDPL